jgi:hypothetical protein
LVVTPWGFESPRPHGELHLTPASAAGQMHYADTVATRLPKTFAALAAGQIHPVHVRIIEDETRVLSDDDAARADAILAGIVPGTTFGELRAAAHKLILKLDPDAARKRKEAARGEAHVRQFRENSGNAGMVARELPSDEVLASWQHVEQRALDLRAAGMPGTLQELRVRAYLDLLQERDSRDLPAGPGPASAPAPGAGAGPSLAALVTLTIPWATWQGRSQTPGQAGGFGPLDGDDARDLAAAAATHPPHPLVHHRAEPRRHRRRPRLPPRPPPPARHRPPGLPAPLHRTR